MNSTALYLCAARDANGEALDLIVEATDAAEAKGLWLAYMAANEWNPIAGFAIVYELPQLTGTARTIDWNRIASAGANSIGEAA